jgi:hypothetical protein
MKRSHSEDIRRSENGAQFEVESLEQNESGFWLNDKENLNGQKGGTFRAPRGH